MEYKAEIAALTATLQKMKGRRNSPAREPKRDDSPVFLEFPDHDSNHRLAALAAKVNSPHPVDSGLVSQLRDYLVRERLKSRESQWAAADKAVWVKGTFGPRNDPDAAVSRRMRAIGRQIGRQYRVGGK